jgi:hypothetical protein
MVKNSSLSSPVTPPVAEEKEKCVLEVSRDVIDHLGPFEKIVAEVAVKTGRWKVKS